MNRTAQNEKLKLLANWLNAVSVTVIGAGGFLPLLSVYVGVGPPMREQWLVWPLVSVCTAIAAGLHLLGAFYLEGLTDG
jgi:amino acid transporter